MSDAFYCPECGPAPRPTDPRAKDEGVCDSCWYELKLNDWFQEQWVLYGKRKKSRRDK